MPWFKALVARRQPFAGWRRIALAALGGTIVIAILGVVGELTDSMLLAASFGASCVLVFTLPDAPVSQPVNAVGGHIVATVCGLTAGVLFPLAWWSVAIAVGAATAAMAALRVTHPPAGSNPIVVMTAGATWGYLLIPIAVGAVILVALGLVFHRLSGTQYPSQPAA